MKIVIIVIIYFILYTGFGHFIASNYDVKMGLIQTAVNAFYKG